MNSSPPSSKPELTTLAPSEAEERLFAAVFRDTHVAIRRYAARRVGVDVADDIVSEVYGAAWRRRGDLPSDPGQRVAWLLRIAHHLVLHEHRSLLRRRRLNDRVAGVRESDSSPADALVDHLVDPQLAVALAAIPILDAEIVLLHAWEGLSPTEIGAVIGCSPAAARVRLHRARRRLQTHLAPLTGPRSPVVVKPMEER